MDLTRVLWIFYAGFVITWNGCCSYIIKRKPSQAQEEYTSQESVIPKLYGFGRLLSSTQLENGHVEYLQMLIPLKNTQLAVDLHLNRHLLPASYIEKYFTSDGREVITKPNGHNTTKHCYYHGTVKDQSDSVAAISTCEGVRGMIVSKNEVFHIEPQESVITGTHLVFKDSEKIKTNHKCSSEGDYKKVLADFTSFALPKKNHRLKRSLYWPYDSNDKTKIVELYVANDILQYQNQDSSVDKVISRTKEIINVASSLYKKVDTHLALVGIEIWTDRNPIDIVENADTTMNNFLEYRRYSINPKHKNDNAQLITGHTFGQGVIGKAPINTICSWKYSGGVNMDHSNLVGPVATTVAHEMGHNFGLAHDVDRCTCPENKCIMNSNSGGTQPHFWSSCSLEQFADSFHQGMDYCLQDLPESVYNGPVCGNGFLEDGEQCDCGIPESCDSKCCNASTCTLFSNATCATGKCCNLNTCQYKPEATSCRSAVDDCDLPEFCHGNSEKCPSDTYQKDGSPCQNKFGESYCFIGRCHNRESQCQKLWGETGHESNINCFNHFNVMGVANGNCGFNWVANTFQKCLAQDVMCGMLHCVHRNEKLVFWKEALSYTMPEGWITVNGQRKDCYGAILDVGLDYEDPGMVPSGAKCGDKKLCVEQKCVDIADLPQIQCPNCHGHGACNHYGQCHCDDGYAPPDCKYAGNGGSKHSGSSNMLKGNTALAVGMAFFCILIIIAVVVALVFGYKYRQKIKEKWLSPKTSDKYRAQPANHVEEPQGRKPQRAAPPPPLKPPTVQKKFSFNKPKNPPPPCSEVKRTPSFRPEDITNLEFSGTTNKNVESLAVLPASLRSPTLEASRVGGQSHEVHYYRNNGATDIRPPHNRPAPGAPSMGVGAHGDESADFPPDRPPPPKRYLTNTKKRHSANIANVSGSVPFSEDCYENIQNSPSGHFEDINLNSPTEESHYEPTSAPLRPPIHKTSATPTDSKKTIPSYPSRVNKMSNVANVKSKFETNKKEPVGKLSAGRSYSHNSNANKPGGGAASVNKDAVPGHKPSLPMKPRATRTQSATANNVAGSSSSSSRKPPLKAKPSLNLKGNVSSDAEC